MALIDIVAKSAPSLASMSGVEMPRPKPMQEFGVTGLNRTTGKGFVYEEFLPALSGQQWKRIYREMRDNDAVIGGMFFALEMNLRRAPWTVEAAKGSGSKGEGIAQFVRDSMDDMEHTWTDFICEGLNMFAFGHMAFETVYKRRQGPSGKASSKFKDGLIGWKKQAPRSPESIIYWIWDDDGNLEGLEQQAAPDYRNTVIPIEKLLLFQTTSIKQNPEGRSLLRNCFVPFWRKRRLEEVEAIGIERDLCGIPVLHATAEALAQMGGGDQVKGQAAAEKLVRNLRNDQQAGVVLPNAWDENGKRMVELSLLQTGGAKQTNPGDTICRYNQDILNTMLSGFLQFGQTPTGSKSLHVSATEIYSQAISAFLDSLADKMNRVAIPRLMALNRMDLELAPKLVPEEAGSRDLEELSVYIKNLSQSGLTFFDDKTANYLRKVGRLPDAPEDKPGEPDAPPEGLEPGRTADAQQAAAGVPEDEKDQGEALENAV